MRFVIVTGMSGAGKTTVLKFLEDIGFFCVDNLPPALITKFSQLCFEQDGSIDKVALGIDIRGGKLFGDLFVGLKELKRRLSGNRNRQGKSHAGGCKTEGDLYH